MGGGVKTRDSGGRRRAVKGPFDFKCLSTFCFHLVWTQCISQNSFLVFYIV